MDKITHAEQREAAFRDGSEIVLARGAHPGTSGVFLRLKADDARR